MKKIKTISKERYYLAMAATFGTISLLLALLLAVVLYLVPLPQLNAAQLQDLQSKGQIIVILLGLITLSLFVYFLKIATNRTIK